MVTKLSPQPVVPKPGGYQSEVASFQSFNDLFRFFQPKRMKMSKNSPPVSGVDVTEGEVIFDKTLLRSYTVIDGNLRYIQWT